MRAGPGTSYKRIKALPYGSRVEVVALENPKFDSLSAIEWRYGATPEDVSRISRHGHWAKVRYKGQVGYMLDLFLRSDANYIRETVGFDDLATDFRLLMPGGNCRDNFHYDPSMDWYGLYRTEDGKRTWIKRVKVSQFIHRDEFSTNFTLADDNEHLLAMIGTRQTIREGLLGKTPATLYLPLTEFDQMEEQARLEKVMGELRLSIRRDDNGNGIRRLVMGGPEGQCLNPEGSELYMANALSFVGDLDGDGKKDLIVQYGEKSARTVLYLSGSARKGEILRPVAVYYAGYCC